ncbi:hypothetical protein SELMODRAFT_48533, partial [Selaginella moellendorffii]
TSWDVLVAAFAYNGQEEHARLVFTKMAVEGIEPREPAFVCLLVGHTHSGDLDSGISLFRSMAVDFHAAPSKQAFNAMVGLLGRSGRLDDARELLIAMPFNPGAPDWKSLLGACTSINNLQRGAQAAENVARLDPAAPAPYLLIANM